MKNDSNVAYYKVGGHCFSLITNEIEMIDRYMPAYTPFKLAIFDVGKEDIQNPLLTNSFQEGANIENGILNLVDEKTLFEENTMPLFSLELHAPIPLKGELVHSFNFEDSQCSFYEDNELNYIVFKGRNGFEANMTANRSWNTCRCSIQEINLESKTALNFFIMACYSFASANRQTLLIHASVIDYQHQGILFLGQSGTGKSTHARLWLDHIHAASLLNDDNPVVRLDKNGNAWVFGSPWSGKTPCYQNQRVLLKAIVRLRQAPNNKMHRLHGGQGFAALLPSCSNLVWNERIHNAICKTISLLIPRCKIGLLDCLPNAEAVKLSADFLNS